MTISRSILLIMRKASDKTCRENQNTHFMFDNFFFNNSTFYEIMRKNMVIPERPQMTIQYGVFTFHVGILRLQTHTKNM